MTLAFVAGAAPTALTDLEGRVKELEETVRQLRETLRALQEAPKPSVEPSQIEKIATLATPPGYAPFAWRPAYPPLAGFPLRRNANWCAQK